MANSLLGSLSELITPDLLSQAASAFGENPDAVGKGLSAAMPMLLGGIAEKASNPSFASTLFNMLSDPKVGGSLLDNPGSLLSGNALTSGPTASIAGSLLAALFGSNQNMVSNMLAKFAGISPATAGSLLKFGAPLILSTLGNKVRSGGLNPGSLVSMLTDQKSEISAALPAGLGNINGLLDRGAAAAAAVPAKAAGSSIWRWLLPLLLLLAGLWLVMQFMGGNKPANQPVQTGMSVPSANVYFETGSANLPAGTDNILGDVVAYLRANPGAKASIAGYHDRTGTADINEQLAKDRAIAVQQFLIAGGIAAGQLELDEPLISTGGSADEARRVEVVVR